MKLEIDKATLLTMQLYRSKHDVRYYLNGIYFNKNGEVAATDGHQIAIGRHKNKIRNSVIVSVSEKPKITNFEKAIIDTKKLTVDYFDDNDVRVAIGLCSIVDGRYPDYNRIRIDEFVAVEDFYFNATYLAKVEKVAKLFNPNWASVLFKSTGTTSAAKAEIKSPDGRTCEIWVMPMRLPA